MCVHLAAAFCTPANPKCCTKLHNAFKPVCNRYVFTSEITLVFDLFPQQLNLNLMKLMLSSLIKPTGTQYRLALDTEITKLQSE